MFLLNNETAKKLFGTNAKLFGDLKTKWTEPHRFYHTEENHLNPMLKMIATDPNTSATEKEMLEIIAYFHDAIYDPKSTTNERDSADFFIKSVSSEASTDTMQVCISAIITCIFETKDMISTNELSAKFLSYDLFPLTHGSTTTLINNGYLLFKEFQFHPIKNYLEGRINFVNNFIKKFEVDNLSLLDYNDYTKTWRPNVGVYSGSFYPFHNGHLNILKKAEKIFDKVIIAQAQNPEKEEKGHEYNNLTEKLKYHQIEILPPDWFITDFIEEQEKYCVVTLIRGLRNGYDFGYELNQYKFLQDIYPGLKTVFIPCDREYDYLSSSSIRAIESIHKGSGEKYGY